MKKTCTLLLLILFFLTACKNNPKPSSFIYLDKLSGRVGFPEYLLETILIENPPKNKTVLDSVMHDFRINKGINLCSVDSSIYKYCISFYLKNSRTSFFIDNREDKRHSIEETYPGAGYAKEELGFFFYARSVENQKMWYAEYPNNYRDTMYCE